MIMSVSRLAIATVVGTAMCNHYSRACEDRATLLAQLDERFPSAMELVKRDEAVHRVTDESELGQSLTALDLELQQRFLIRFGVLEDGKMQQLSSPSARIVAAERGMLIVLLAQPEDIRWPNMDRALTRSERQSGFWSSAIFQLFSCRNNESLLKLVTRLRSGVMAEDEWVTEALRIEHEALAKRADFYYSVWHPYCVANDIEPHAWLWQLDVPKNADHWVRLVSCMNRFSNYIEYWRELAEFYRGGD